jgi:hypothetical protein
MATEGKRERKRKRKNAGLVDEGEESRRERALSTPGQPKLGEEAARGNGDGISAARFSGL